MKLLVSPRGARGALEAVRGGADIVDVKNPEEGSLGASFPWKVREVVEAVKGRAELSATAGDLDFKPGSASLVAHALASLGVDYVKAGFYGIRTPEQAVEMGRAVVRAASEYGARVVLACYADHARVGSLAPAHLPEVAQECGAHGVMIDTAIKQGGGLFSCMPEDEIRAFVELAHELGLVCALAGRLSLGDLLRVKELGADIAGVRSAACEGGRREAGISAERVRQLKRLVG